MIPYIHVVAAVIVCGLAIRFLINQLIRKDSVKLFILKMQYRFWTKLRMFSIRTMDGEYYWYFLQRSVKVKVKLNELQFKNR